MRTPSWEKLSECVRTAAIRAGKQRRPSVVRLVHLLAEELEDACGPSFNREKFIAASVGDLPDTDPAKAARLEAMRAMYETGASLAAVGKAFGGISGQAVSAQFHGAGIPVRRVGAPGRRQ